MRLVILESPYAGDVEANLTYARACGRDCALRGDAILASHLLYPQFLDDTIPAERKLGIELGLAWRAKADLSIFYTDRGWSSGMLAALHSAIEHNFPFELRSLYGAHQLPATLDEDVFELLISCIKHK
jgi:hypothetical protein